ncbi:MAG: AmmeMemoRadiSam system radical SAM enzyme, partial [Oscillospiraceae bacterium]|nr:AmmeMemoRadiSam system radical SAM enzyme [Oscillospiraceae bacterium]
MSDRPALFWEAGENGAARCALCPRRCTVAEGAAGLCGARENRGGTLYAAGYGRISALSLDPMEKKPLCRFRPGTRILSVGGFGCNLRCPFCQNHGISMPSGGWEADLLTPEELTRLAVRAVPRGSAGVAYTYNEPLIGYEFVYDCAGLVREAGLCNVLVTNGTANREPLERLLPRVDALNIDLKGFSDRFYQTLGGCLGTVKETIALAAAHSHVEVTTLVIPGENDSEEEIEALSAWLASLDRDIPLHLSRFFPRHRYSDRTPTPRET